MEIKVGKCYDHEQFRDVIFQVLGLEENGIHVLWWHKRNKSRLLGEDVLRYGQWLEEIEEIPYLRKEIPNVN